MDLYFVTWGLFLLRGLSTLVLYFVTLFQIYFKYKNFGFQNYCFVSKTPFFTSHKFIYLILASFQQFQALFMKYNKFCEIWTISLIRNLLYQRLSRLLFKNFSKICYIMVIGIHKAHF